VGVNTRGLSSPKVVTPGLHERIDAERTKTRSQSNHVSWGFLGLPLASPLLFAFYSLRLFRVHEILAPNARLAAAYLIQINTYSANRDVCSSDRWLPI
jgi:hypothetical protein